MLENNRLHTFIGTAVKAMGLRSFMHFVTGRFGTEIILDFHTAVVPILF